jgi:hypothetical protein
VVDNFILGGDKCERTKKFKYLGSLMIENCSVSKDARVRIATGNTSDFALQTLFKSYCIRRNTKLVVYNAVVRLVVAYGSDTSRKGKY